MEWERYKDNSGETDTSVLWNHLLMCADEDLRKTLHKLHGSSLQTMSLADLMAAIEKTAVEKQYSLLNLVELLSKVDQLDWNDTISNVISFCDL